jgi:uncharacterized protein
MDELASIIPLFPLPNLVLFPGVQVPLHIFEPRYREMVGEVAGGDRLVGMMLLKGDWEHDYYGHPDVFQIGCAGRIGQIVKLPDGRFNLILEGLREFRIVEEIRDRSFRRARVEWCRVERQSLELNSQEMEELRERLVSYVGEAAVEAWRTVVQQRGLRGADLINFICFHLDLTPLEKQTLLEALDARTRCLMDVLTFRIEDRKLGPGGSRGGSNLMQ